MLPSAVEVDFSRYNFKKIVIRQAKTGLYLMPSGEWGNEREAARDFVKTDLAFWWAKEKELLNFEILMIFSDPQYDFVTMRVQ